MNHKNRQYSCKNEELLPISKFTLFSLKRDIADFSAFSTIFNEQYVTETESFITQVENVLEPKNETLALKLITQEIDQLLIQLQQILLTTEGYLKLLKKELKITPAAFGISGVRKSLNNGDVESILQGIKVLSANLQHHAAPFEQKGMPATIFQNLQELQTAIGEKKQKQFEIKTARAAIVQDNLTIFNTLYLRLTEIYNIGKVLYKTTNPAKYDEYTFTKLIKKVRNTRSPKSNVQSPMSEVNTL